MKCEDCGAEVALVVDFQHRFNEVVVVGLTMYECTEGACCQPRMKTISAESKALWEEILAAERAGLVVKRATLQGGTWHLESELSPQQQKTIARSRVK